MLAQRVDGLAVGYQDLNDHRELRKAVLGKEGDRGSLAEWKQTVEGESERVH
jgi:hypothetical protein